MPFFRYIALLSIPLCLAKAEETVETVETAKEVEAVETVETAHRTFPYQVHCGALSSLERTQEKRCFAKLDEAYLKNAMKAQEHVPESMRVMKAPHAGDTYVVLTFDVKQGRTLSRFDYLLQSESRKFKCLGIALQSNEVYDIRRLIVNGPCSACMLFECPDTLEAVNLVPAEGFPLMPVNDLRLLPDMPEQTQEATGD